MLHHCLAGRQRASLIKMEITPELKVMRCRHAATFLPSSLRQKLWFYVEGLQPGNESAITWFNVFSRCTCVICVYVYENFWKLSIKCGLISRYSCIITATIP